ncbi:MAG: hypothetical protein ABR594_13805 [Pyrinomonadaceae bacterium]
MQKMEPRKSCFIEVRPSPCSPEEAQDHLRAFAESFIKKAFVDRWLHITLEKPKKAEEELRKFENHLDARYCTMLHGADSFPVSLAEAYGSKRGVYFDGSEPACRMTAPEASSLATERNADALFSLTPGKLALFFFHEGYAWKCERRT